MNTTAAVLFVIFIGATLVITWWAGKRNTSVESHLVAQGRISGKRNGLAIAGDLVSAATFLGTTAAIAFSGFNGYYYAIFIPMAFLLALLLVAEPLRNLGRFTLGDVVATRFPSDNVRATIGVSAVVVSILYVVAQFVGAALLVQLLFGIDYLWAAIIIAVLTTVYTLFGGMIATTYIQIVQTILLLIAGVVLIVLVLSNFGFNPMQVFASIKASPDAALLQPLRESPAAQWEQFSLIFGVTLGVLGLPHILVRFLTVPSAKEARSSAVTSIWIFSGFLIFMPILSFGAVSLYGGRKGLMEEVGNPNLTVTALGKYLGGDTLLAFVAAVTFLVILSSLAGLIIATSGAISHDLYANVLKKGRVDPKQQLTVARIATFVSAAIATAIALVAQQYNVAFLATLAIAVAASAMLPALLLTMYWRKTTAIGVAVGMVFGLLTALLVILQSPIFRGENAFIPISSPAIISLPVGFIVMMVVSLLTQPKGDEARKADAIFDRIRIKMVTKVDPGDPTTQDESIRIRA
ncbi:cation acetate symporter [Janibacter sp. GXQ6167]|uniref:solute symporter family protein n=1 Tax=Janibacter sp. GXQ6167 TaxID=3240791 RepID=UPI003524042B